MTDHPPPWPASEPLPRDQAQALHRRLDQRAYTQRARERRRQLKARAIYAVGALQLIIVLVYGWVTGAWDWSSIIPTATVCLLLILAGLDDGRLW